MKGKWGSVAAIAIILVSVILASPSISSAQAGFPGGTYSQNFDTLANTAGSTTNTALPTGWALTETGGGTRDNEQYAVDTGGSNTGDTYSYGAAASTERAFGGLQSGSLIPVIGVQFQNNAGRPIGTLSIAYMCEQWRLGATGRTDRMDFQYSTDATSLTTGTWTDVDALDCLGAVSTGTVGALNGNDAANRTSVSNSITGLNIANNATFWFRWNSSDATGADDGLAVDDFTLSALGTNAVTLRALTAAAPLNPLAAVPVVGLALAGGLAAWRRRKA